MSFESEIQRSSLDILQSDGKNAYAFPVRSQKIWRGDAPYQKVILSGVPADSVKECIDTLRNELKSEEHNVPISDYELLGKENKEKLTPTFKLVALSLKRELVEEFLRMRFFSYEDHKILILKFMSFKERKRLEKKKTESKLKLGETKLSVESTTVKQKKPAEVTPGKTMAVKNTRPKREERKSEDGTENKQKEMVVILKKKNVAKDILFEGNKSKDTNSSNKTVTTASTTNIYSELADLDEDGNAKRMDADLSAKEPSSLDQMEQ